LQASPAPAFLSSPDTFKAHVLPLLDFLHSARPTAVNLGAATRRLTKTLQASVDAGKDGKAIAQDLIAEGKNIDGEDVGRNKEMAKQGGEWLIDHVKSHDETCEDLNVLTVCNTGSLATSVRVLYSTNLHPI
jgi:methylthioribose-1-phosphate isomerase